MVPSPNGTSVMTWFMRMLTVTGGTWSAYFSRIALAAVIHSSDRNWWDMSGSSCARESCALNVQIVQSLSETGRSRVTMDEWHRFWSPKRSPRAVSTASGRPGTRSSSSWTCPACSTRCARRPRPDHPLRHAGHRRGARSRHPNCVVVGRAGIGLDNVDVEAATRRGVMVVNAPQSNIVSAAEHTMALLLTQARNVPQAHAALKAGRWERARWEGVELADKTLGDHRSRSHRQAGRRSSEGVRHAAHRLRPVRVRRPRPPDGRRARDARPGRRRGRLPHRAPAADEGDHRADQPRPAVEGQALAAGHQRGPWRHRRRAGAGRLRTRRHHRRRRGRRVRHRADHVVAAVRAGRHRRHPAPRCEHPRGAGQGRRHHRRHGAAGPRRRLRAVRGQRRRGRSQRDAASVPAAGRAPRSTVLVARRRVVARGRAGRSSRSAPRATSPATTRASSHSLR